MSCRATVGFLGRCAALAATIAVSGAGCSGPSYGETPFSCAETPRCPDGYRCIDGLCQRHGEPGTDGAQPDGPGTPDAAPPPDLADARTQQPGDGPGTDGVQNPPDGAAPIDPPFTAVHPLTELNSTTADDSEPSLTADLLEIFFQSNRGAGHKDDTDIWTATRTAISAPWSAPVAVSALNTAQAEATPEVAADGLTIFFASNRQGGGAAADVYVATRASRGASWSAPQLVGALSSPDDDRSPTPGDDLLTLALSSTRTGGAGSADLYQSTRASSTATWGQPAALPGVNTAAGEWSPWLGDGRTLLYFTSDRGGGKGGTDLWRARRPNLAAPFGPAAPVAELNSAAAEQGCWLSPDGSLIVFASARDGTLDLYAASR